MAARRKRRTAKKSRKKTAKKAVKPRVSPMAYLFKKVDNQESRIESIESKLRNVRYKKSKPVIISSTDSEKLPHFYD